VTSAYAADSIREGERTIGRLALASLRDPESANAIKARYAVSRNDDINVRFALEWVVLQKTDVSYQR
jgi:hypothetical protein